MRVLIVFFLTLILSCRAFAFQTLEEIFKGDALFIRVPRGLIVSFDENLFFRENETLIKRTALPLLNSLGEKINSTDNEIVVESHGGSVENSIMRANNIIQYLIRYSNVRPDRIFAVGFGQIAPQIGAENSRLDFVIIDYNK